MVFVERLFFGFNLGGSGKVVVIWGSFRMFVRFLGVFFKKVQVLVFLDIIVILYGLLYSFGGLSRGGMVGVYFWFLKQIGSTQRFVFRNISLKVLFVFGILEFCFRRGYIVDKEKMFFFIFELQKRFIRLCNKVGVLNLFILFIYLVWRFMGIFILLLK